MELFSLWIKRLGLFFTLLFCIELIFGYSGTMVMIKGIAIRHILFILSAVFLYCYCFLYTYVHKISWLSLKNKTSVFGSFTIMDWAMLLFILSTVVSFLVMPQIYHGSLYLAKCEILDSLCMLLFYFPIRFMIQWHELSFAKVETILLYSISFLAALHILLYVGQFYHSGFIEGYFALLTKLSGGTAVTPGIVLGHGGYPRVMYSTSIYLLVGIYLLIKKLPQWKIYDYFLAAIMVTALMTTMTKSLWYGVFFGIGCFTVAYIVKFLRKKEWKPILQWCGIILGSILLVVILNATVFDGIVEARLNNSFALTEKEKPNANKYEKLDGEGAVISNQIKVKQTAFLLKAWQEHPIMGTGYGSYLKDFIRSDKAVFSYEMFLPAMLMKIGVIGVGLLLFLVVSSIFVAGKTLKTNGVKFFAWLYLLIAFGACIQTNPLLLSFNGISVVLLILWSSFSMKQEKEKNGSLT